ncbi:ATP-binding protein [Haloarchaeobius sp. TZWWS8]|uniref:ATP-binding protein n=1 Tax=Haloarchaeobius sp. TZWWS8 TaxID=3446121 RepID=UPI003EBCD9CB
MDEYLRDFVQESDENITELNNALLELERDPDHDGAMDRIFRMAHTLKGNAGAMGFHRASNLAHAIEDLLEAVRSGKIAVSPELMDEIFDGVDELETMLEEIRTHGEIRTDPSETIERLRAVRAEATGLPTVDRPDEAAIDAAIAAAGDLSDPEHDVFHVRLAINEAEDGQNGTLVVTALADAFDLLGTVPDERAIAAGEYDGSFDALFGSAVGEAAITAALAPVEAVADSRVTEVTDAYETATESVDEPDDEFDDLFDDEPGADIDSDAAQEMSVDDLLSAFDDYDDLDAMIEEMDDVSGFDDLGDAGSFDDIDFGEDSPAEDELATGSDDGIAVDEPGESDTEAEAEPPAVPDEEPNEQVDDAAATFAELKEEVDPVGFDELQAELDELEFDEYADEEEVGFDELLGEDFEESDDDFFATGGSSLDSGEDEVSLDELVGDDLDAGDDIAADAQSDPTDVSGSDVSAAGDSEVAVEADADSEVAVEADADGKVAAEADGADVAEADAAVVDADGADDDTTDAGDSDVDEPDSIEADVDAPVVTDDSDDDSFGGSLEERVEETSDSEIESESGGVTEPELVDESDQVDESSAVEPEADDDFGGGFTDASADEFGGGFIAGFDDGTDDFELESADPSQTAAAAARPVSDTDSATGAADTDDADGSTTTDEADSTVDVSEVLDAADEFETPDAADVAGEFGSSDDADDTDPLAGDPSPDDVDGDEGAADTGSETTLDTGTDETRRTSWSRADDEDLDSVEVGTFELGEPDESETVDATVDTADFDEVATDSGFEAAASQSDSVGFGAGEDVADFSELAGFDSGFDEPPEEAASEQTETDSESAGPVVDGSAYDVDIQTLDDERGDDERESEIQSVRIDVEQIDRLLNLVEGLVTSRVRLRRTVEEGADPVELDNELDELEDITGELQDTVMDVRLVPVKMATNKLPRVVRDIAREQDKQVAFDIEGESVEVDRSILDQIADPLVHIVRNAVDHGVEEPDEREAAGKEPVGEVTLRAERARDQVVIEVEDDGRGLDADRLRREAVEQGVLTEDDADELSETGAHELIFHPGLSTASEVTDVSGRGVGMDVVKSTVSDLDGSVEVESEPGVGTTIRLLLPVTVAIADVLFVQSGDEEFGVPVKVLRDIGPVPEVDEVDGQEVIVDGDDSTPLVRLDDALDTPGESSTGGDGMVLRIRDEVRTIALHCDEVRGQQEVVVKPFEGVLGGIPGLSGATVLGEGEVVNILDVKTL